MARYTQGARARMAKAIFQRNQKVWVESVGAWAVIEKESRKGQKAERRQRPKGYG